MEPRLDEESECFPDSPSAAAREYAELGERVAGVLRAAEEAADEIQEEAHRKVDALRRRAETEARAQVENERAKAAADAGRLRNAAVADAESIRDAAQAAAGRIAQEGQRRLGALREDARALEGRFESAVDDLHDLIAQLEAVVRNAAERPMVVVEESDADTDPGRAIEDDLWPRGEAAEPAEDTSDAHTRPS
jgi:DNA repair exonuclease SbcCD ATPase subunit